MSTALAIGMPGTAYANTDNKAPASTAKPSADTTVIGAKLQKCSALKRRIAAHQAAPKGQKNPGDETIKADIAWYQQNCV